MSPFTYPPGDLVPADWEAVWESGVSPGAAFDKESVLPDLQEALSSGSLPRGGRVLVPGCGRGYDVEAFGRSGHYTEVIGADVSATAVTAANAYLRGAGAPAACRVVRADFFDTDLRGVFQVVYDYTFFCAIPLARRPAWGARMAALVQRGGVLVTGLYPVGKPRAEGGPPHGVAPDDYAQALTAFRKVELRPVHRAHSGREGRTWWAVWERV